MKRTISPALLLLASILLAACAAAPVDSTPGQALPDIDKEAPMPTATPLEPIPGGFPQAAFAAREALAEQLGVAVDEIEIRNIEPVEWPDGCLGLGGADEMCTQALVPGYRVTLVSGAAQYIYRTSERGSALRREMGVSFAGPDEEARPFVTWQNPECTEEASILLEGLSFGACGGPYTVSAWQTGTMPDLMLEFLDKYAAFEAEMPAGKLVFNGIGTTVASPAEQRAIAEWMKIQFLVAQSGRAGAAWGLAFSYSRQGGFAGFCDDLTVYLDGSVILSSCKDVNIDFRLDAEQLAQVYAWYDNLKSVDYSYTDPGVADAMTTKLVLPGQGDKTADEAALNEILVFCAELIRQGRTTPP